MIQYTDTHCHLNSIMNKLKCNQISEIKKLYPIEFKQCITISCDLKSIEITSKIMHENSWIYASFGMHPHEAKDYNQIIENKISSLMSHPKVVAWGEIGLDYFYKHTDKITQKKVFITQITQAIKNKKPLIIHTRNAELDTIDIMKEHIPKDWKIHVHCFTSSTEMAQELLNYFSNLYLGFTGIITFKNAQSVINTVKKIPLNKILLETDAPYLSPIPHRGKPAHSGYIPLIAQKISEIKDMSIETVYTQTNLNTQAVYGI